MPNSSSIPAFNNQVVASDQRTAFSHLPIKPARRTDKDIERLLAGLPGRTDHHLDQQTNVLRILGNVEIELRIRAMEAANSRPHGRSVMVR